MRGEDAPSPTEALASRKVVYREVSTEGSEPAKSGTDEQKRHKRHIYSGKQPTACEPQREEKDIDVDVAVIGGRKKLLPGEVSAHRSCAWRSQQRS